ncbi:MAG: hypothetical protein HRU69_09285 [Flammeovirgaceae bacterium]|nr:MAG: hypothetical protein HRU69_09285 [Flammeovirgaceae bacterium]
MKKALIIPAITGTAALVFILAAFTSRVESRTGQKTLREIPKGCVFRTVMGEESSDSSFIYLTPDRVAVSITRGLSWIARAQNQNGGWGAGSHYRQDIMDPHAVQTDPATTSMVAMALLRSGSTLTSGEYSMQLGNALHYLFNAVETAPAASYNITQLTGTQIQTKLGANIDVVLTAQFLSNILEHTNHDKALKDRVKKNLNTCVAKIQSAQDKDGSMRGDGWAGVLQSSFATTALEAAQANGASVDADALRKSREFQKNNYDAKTGESKTDRGAGIVLYSVSGSTRASAKEARRVQEEMELAKRNGTLPQSAAPSAENLEKLGFSKDDAMRYATAYEVYQSAKQTAQRDEVMDGFGNNGGEEFLSYLQTGEGMIIGKDQSWKNWYENMSGRLIKIQNNDGSWNGHHCITSPVFCTATCLLILSVNNDVERLIKMGKEK